MLFSSCFCRKPLALTTFLFLSTIFPSYSCELIDQSLSYKVLSSSTKHYMSINGGAYFPCSQGKSRTGNLNWICGKKDFAGFFGLGNSVQFSHGFDKVIDNRGSMFDLDSLDSQRFTPNILTGCQDLGNGRVKLVNEQILSSSLHDKRFSHKIVKERIVRSYRPSLNINQ